MNSVFENTTPLLFHQVLIVDALPRVFNGKGDAHPSVEEDELEEEEDGEDSVLDLA